MINKFKNYIKSLLYGEDYEKDEDSWWDCIQARYWLALPYSWRPGQIWYRTKCFVWYRWTTIKPRTLKYHTYCDRCHLMPHMMFEILTAFVEEECSPGIVDWYHNEKDEEGNSYGCSPRIVPGEMWNYDKINDPKSVWVLDEMKELIRWWKEVYLVEKPEECDENGCWKEYHEFSEKHKIKSDIFSLPYKFDTPENEEKSMELLRGAMKRDEELCIELNQNLIRIVNVINFMWT